MGTGYAYRPLEEIKQRDETKKQLAQSKGITLITVPCWWDGTIERYVHITTTHSQLTHAVTPPSL